MARCCLSKSGNKDEAHVEQRWFNLCARQLQRRSLNRLRITRVKNFSMAKQFFGLCGIFRVFSFSHSSNILFLRRWWFERWLTPAWKKLCVFERAREKSDRAMISHIFANKKFSFLGGFWAYERAKKIIEYEITSRKLIGDFIGSENVFGDCIFDPFLEKVHSTSWDGRHFD